MLYRAMGMPMPSKQSAVSPATAEATLEVYRQGVLESRLPLSGKGVLMGRVADCDLQLDDRLVSRHHARLDRAPHGQWCLSDLESHNGTRVNGVTQHKVLLSNGDRIGLGPFTILFRETDDEPARFEATTAMNLAFTDQAVSINTLKELAPPAIAVEQLGVLNDFSRALLDTPDAPDRLLALCRLMLHPKLGGLWAVAAAMNPAALDQPPVALLPPEWASPDRYSTHTHLSRSLLRTACQRSEPVMASNAPVPGNINIELSIAADVVSMAAVAIPLTDRTHSGGGASAARPPSKVSVASGVPSGPETIKLLYAAFPPHYGTGEWLALCALAVHHYRQSEIIWNSIAQNRKLAAIEADLERARRVQDGLVPRYADLPGLNIAIGFKPCHAVGGDYVDAIALPGGQALLIIADVCGKGLSAAMITMQLHTLVHSVARRWIGLADLAAAIDAHLAATMSSESFVTLLAILLDPVTGAMQSINGGHPAAMVVAADGTCRRVADANGFPVGVESQTLEVEHSQLAPDELLVLFTDGCFELRDRTGRMMGPDKFCEAAAAGIKGTTPALAADRITGMLDEIQDTVSLPDDRTMLIARRR
jgi:hypothetical protein